MPSFDIGSAMKIFDRLFGPDDEARDVRDDALGRADRRAFLVGATVTAAGLVVPKATIFLPPAPMLRKWAVSARWATRATDPRVWSDDTEELIRTRAIWVR